jgi:excisionase family DNA binding protein
LYLWTSADVQEKGTVFMTKILLRPAEAAELIGVSRSKIYELIASGAVPSVRLEGGRLIRVPAAALERMASDAMEPDRSRPGLNAPESSRVIPAYRSALDER